MKVDLYHDHYFDSKCREKIETYFSLITCKEKGSYKIDKNKITYRYHSTLGGDLNLEATLNFFNWYIMFFKYYTCYTIFIGKIQITDDSHIKIFLLE